MRLVSASVREIWRGRDILQRDLETCITEGCGENILQRDVVHRDLERRERHTSDKLRGRISCAGIGCLSSFGPTWGRADREGERGKDRETDRGRKMCERGVIHMCVNKQCRGGVLVQVRATCK